jgi:hypothetical protein
MKPPLVMLPHSLRLCESSFGQFLIASPMLAPLSAFMDTMSHDSHSGDFLFPGEVSIDQKILYLI